MDEFIEMLSVQTELTYDKALMLVSFIYNEMGTLDTAYKIYEEQSVGGLELYAKQLLLGVKY